MKSVEDVMNALRRLKQPECYVGNSGAEWVGVYDKRNEEHGGTKLPELSRDLSLTFGDVYVLAILQGEEGFRYWLYRGGQKLDSHPATQVGGVLFMRRAILDLCPTKQDKDQAQNLLYPKKAPNLIDFKMTEEELRAEIQRNKARRQKMAAAAEHRGKTTEAQRKIFHTDRYAIEVLSKILGIEYYWLLYSDFSPYDLPPTFEHIDQFLR